MTRAAPRVAIDASNLRRGGGVTHLVELLHHADEAVASFSHVTVFGSSKLLDQLPERAWLTRRSHPALERNLAARTMWQRRELTEWCKSNCDILFVPGGQYIGSFRPFVTMCRNMIPFDDAARALYRGSRIGMRLTALRWLHTRSFRRASGVIFLTETARQIVTEVTGPLSATVIAHGVSNRFRACPRQQFDLATFSTESPFHWLYVSIVDLYKHQPEVARAAAHLRSRGFPIVIDFVGPTYGPAKRDLEAIRKAVDPGHDFLRHTPAVPHQDLPTFYKKADAFIFASSCENMPNILLEAMAAGLPIACSDREPMPEILGDSGCYFDPADSESIARAMVTLMENTELRTALARSAYDRSRTYSWAQCAQETFSFLHDTASGRND